MKTNLLALVLLVALGPGGAALAREAAPAAEDPVLEQRMMELAGQLRCLQCQNQSIAESNAPLAADLRNEIRDQLRRGASESEVVAFMVDRYGEFVLLRPPLKLTTILLWSGPLLLLLAGLIALVYQAVRPRAAGDIKLSEAEHARALRLLGPRSRREFS